jgi:hypothetical protein
MGDNETFFAILVDADWFHWSGTFGKSIAGHLAIQVFGKETFLAMIAAGMLCWGVEVSADSAGEFLIDFIHCELSQSMLEYRDYLSFCQYGS